MFIIDLKYIQPISEIEKFLPKHIEFLEENYANGNLIMSGRKNPRTGGMMFCTLKTEVEVLKMLNEDPFKINNLAEYSLTEFLPTKTCEELRFMLPKTEQEDFFFGEMMTQAKTGEKVSREEVFKILK